MGGGGGVCFGSKQACPLGHQDVTWIPICDLGAAGDQQTDFEVEIADAAQGMTVSHAPTSKNGNPMLRTLTDVLDIHAAIVLLQRTPMLWRSSWNQMSQLLGLLKCALTHHP